MSEGIKKILKKMKKNAQFLAHFPLSAEGNRGEKKVQKSEKNGPFLGSKRVENAVFSTHPRSEFVDFWSSPEETPLRGGQKT